MLVALCIAIVALVALPSWAHAARTNAIQALEYNVEPTPTVDVILIVDEYDEVIDYYLVYDSTVDSDLHGFRYYDP